MSRTWGIKIALGRWSWRSMILRCGRLVPFPPPSSPSCPVPLRSVRGRLRCTKSYFITLVNDISCVKKYDIARARARARARVVSQQKRRAACSTYIGGKGGREVHPARATVLLCVNCECIAYRDSCSYLAILFFIFIRVSSFLPLFISQYNEMIVLL